ncbi:MAG: hypothetical protein WBF06_11785, partial [Candidatus Acidiferrales bacterium]
MLKLCLKTISSALLYSLCALLLSPGVALAGGTAPNRSAKLQGAATPQAAPAPAIAAMSEELAREMPILSQADPPAYFIRYTLTSSDRMEVSGSNGALLSSDHNLSRWLEAQVRVGSYTLDNTHQVGNAPPAEPASYGRSAPVENDPAVLKREVWAETQKQYRSAAESFIKIETSKEVQAQAAEGAAPDFSHEDAHVSYGPEVALQFDRTPWEAKVRLYTKTFRESPQILNSIATFTADAENEYQVSSEGSRLQFGNIRYRLELFIQGKAPDGMDIDRYYNFDWTDPAEAPSDATVLAECAALRKELEALVVAPLVEPFEGPALLTGRAAAVYFHEVFGHRDEGF